MKKKLVLILVIAMVLTCALAAACDGEFTVTFDAQNGTEPVVVSFTDGFTLPETPTNGDKVFGGWYIDKNCTDGNEWSLPSLLEGSITVYAKWVDADNSSTVYTVTFDQQNGTKIIMDFTADFALPTTPTNGDKVFGGWYTDRDCTDGNEWTVPATLTANITVYAKWTETSAYTVTFDAQNGTEVVAVKLDSNFAMPTDPTNGDKVFAGWFTSKDGGLENAFNAATVDGDITVYALWFDAVDLSDIFAQYTGNVNFTYSYVMYDESDADSLYYNDVVKFSNDVFAFISSSNGKEYCDYLLINDTQAVYYVDNGDGGFTVIDYEEDYYSFTYYYSYAALIDLSELGDFTFYENDDHYTAIIPADVGTSVLGNWGDGYAWYEVNLYVTDGKISKITAVLQETEESLTYLYDFVVEISNLGETTVTLPDVSVNNDAALDEILQKYVDDSKWNFQVEYIVNDGENTSSEIMQMYGAYEKITYEYDGVTYVEYLVYDENTGDVIYYEQQTDGTYISYSTEFDDDYYYVYIAYYYIFDYVDISQLANVQFNATEEEGHYTAAYPYTASLAIFDDLGLDITSFHLYVANGQITSIVVNGSYTYTDDDEGSTEVYNYTYTLNFSKFGESDFTLPEATPNSTGNSNSGSDENLGDSSNNDATLAEVLDKYADVDSWNFQIAYVVTVDGETWADDILQFLGENMSMLYEYKGTTFIDYLFYDETTDQYIYYYQDDDGSYTAYYSEDDYEYFAYLYNYVDYVDLSELYTCEFTSNADGGYDAVAPNAVGNLVFGEYDDCVYTSFTIYISNGNISKIVAVQEDSSDDYAGTYTYTLTFSKHGQVSFTAPSVDGSDDGEIEGEYATVTIDSFSSLSSKYDYFNWSANGISGIAYIYGGETSKIQMNAKKKTYYLASTTATPSGITAIKVVTSGGSYNFELLTSSSAYGKVSGAPTSGTSQGEKTVTTSGVTWILDGTDTYFCLVSQEKGAVYIKSITIYFGDSVVDVGGDGSSNGGSNNGGSNNGGSNNGSSNNGSSNGSSSISTMPDQVYDADTFDNSNIQDQLLKADEAIGLPSVGTYSALVVPVQFTGYTFTDSQLDTLNKAFNGTAEDTGWQSVNSYYKLSSYNNLNLTFDIQTAYQAVHTPSYYASSKGSDGYANGDSVLLEEVIAYLNTLGINPSDYDYNNDGTIDTIYLIYSYTIDYSGGDFWWAYTTWYDGSAKVGTKDVYYYLFAGYDFVKESVSGGYTNSSYPVISGLKINASTFIHESGHALGLDDYYDYYENRGSNLGLGSADMMDYTVGDHNVYSKIMLGWIEPTIVTTTQTITIQSMQASATNNCILIPLNFNNSYFSEYLLIDLYTNDGLNALHSNMSNTYLYGGAAYGARIYLVSSAVDLSSWSNSTYPSITKYNNSITSTALIRLIEADGKTTHTTSGNTVVAGDLWQTGKTLKSVWKSFARTDGKLVNFDISFDSVTAEGATITITYNTAA